ncbi:MAG: DUF126 domain-containing protein [Desulfurococcaceae archaeon]
MYAGVRVRVKPIIPGECKGSLLILDRHISFFGEVDPETGCLKEGDIDICIDGKVLAFRGSRGSTVGPYVLYALKKNAKAPLCMLVEEVEPMLVAGCVLGDIPLYVVEPFSVLSGIPDGAHVEVREGELYVRW